MSEPDFTQGWTLEDALRLLPVEYRDRYLKAKETYFKIPSDKRYGYDDYERKKWIRVGEDVDIAEDAIEELKRVEIEQWNELKKIMAKGDYIAHARREIDQPIVELPPDIWLSMEVCNPILSTITSGNVTYCALRIYEKDKSPSIVVGPLASTENTDVLYKPKRGRPFEPYWQPAISSLVRELLAKSDTKTPKQLAHRLLPHIKAHSPRVVPEESSNEYDKFIDKIIRHLREHRPDFYSAVLQQKNDDNA